jgi:hypothetical protein
MFLHIDVFRNYKGSSFCLPVAAKDLIKVRHHLGAIQHHDVQSTWCDTNFEFFLSFQQEVGDVSFPRINK